VTAVATRLDLNSAIGRFRADYEEILRAPSPSPELVEKLANDGAFLSTVQRDIQQNVRRPISYTEISAIQELLELVISVLSQEVVSSALKAPVSASSLEEEGYNLLDQISEYSIVAEHFFDEDVKKAREKLTTNEVCIDVKAVSDMSKAVKKEVLKYIADVLKSFASFKD
jgi:hypothetical protein